MPIQTDITRRTPKKPVTVSASKVMKILYQISNVTGSDICTYKLCLKAFAEELGGQNHCSWGGGDEMGIL